MDIKTGLGIAAIIATCGYVVNSYVSQPSGHLCSYVRQLQRNEVSRGDTSAGNIVVNETYSVTGRCDYDVFRALKDAVQPIPKQKIVEEKQFH